MLEDIERDRTRLARVHVPGVFARPAKRFPLHALHAADVDLARFPKVKFRFRKIVADHADQIHWRKEARAQRRVGGRTAELIGVFFDRRFNGVECDGTNDENRHKEFLDLGISIVARGETALAARAYSATSAALQQAGDDHDALRAGGDDSREDFPA